METISIISILMAAAGVFVSIITGVWFFLGRTQKQLYETQKVTVISRKATFVKLESISHRLQELEMSIGVESIAGKTIQNVQERLVDIEKTIEPIKKRSAQVSSAEYQFLIYEMERIERDLKEDLRRQQDNLIERQRVYENSLEHRLGTLRTIFMSFLAVISLLIAGFGVVIFFISRG